jgi:hypothetical protein
MELVDAEALRVPRCALPSRYDPNFVTALGNYRLPSAVPSPYNIVFHNGPKARPPVVQTIQ